jgi:3'-phosphoadenosine 5'-phosphosulfate sulfotransferase (PAPS reductase)/FAD synthetase
MTTKATQRAQTDNGQLALAWQTPAEAEGLTFDPTEAHCWLLSTSGGKDSQAMIDECHRLARVLDFRGTIVAVHCDLGRVEWGGTAELAEEQATHYGYRFLKVSRPQGDLLDQVEKRGQFPGMAQRFCTSDHKRGQVQKVITMLHREWKAEGNTGEFRLLNVMGLRAQESDAREKLEPVTANKRASCGTRTVTDWLPIHAWSEAQVWARIKQSGVRYHRAYDLGMGRLSCVFCIYSPRAALMIAARANPELLDTYIALEQKIGHTLQAAKGPGKLGAEGLVTIRRAINAGEAAGQVGSWGAL